MGDYVQLDFPLENVYETKRERDTSWIEWWQDIEHILSRLWGSLNRHESFQALNSYQSNGAPLCSHRMEECKEEEEAGGKGGENGRYLEGGWIVPV